MMSETARAPMLGIVTRLSLSPLLAASIASLFPVSAGVAGAGPPPHAGPVTGVIDGIQYGSDQYYVSGWACQEGNRGSIEVHIYAGHAAGATPEGTFVTGG